MIDAKKQDDCGNRLWTSSTALTFSLPLKQNQSRTSSALKYTKFSSFIQRSTIKAKLASSTALTFIIHWRACFHFLNHQPCHFMTVIIPVSIIAFANVFTIVIITAITIISIVIIIAVVITSALTFIMPIVIIIVIIVASRDSFKWFWDGTEIAEVTQLDSSCHHTLSSSKST